MMDDLVERLCDEISSQARCREPWTDLRPVVEAALTEAVQGYVTRVEFAERERGEARGEVFRLREERDEARSASLEQHRLHLSTANVASDYYAQLSEARAEIARLTEERDHERHEKETVADASKALIEWHRKKLTDLVTTARHYLPEWGEPEGGENQFTFLVAALHRLDSWKPFHELQKAAEHREQALRDENARLKDPAAVHALILRGDIALPEVSQRRRLLNSDTDD